MALTQIKCGDLYGTPDSYVQADKSFHKALTLYKQAIVEMRKQEKPMEEIYKEIVHRIRFIKGKQKELRDKKVILPDEDSPLFLVFNHERKGDGSEVLYTLKAEPSLSMPASSSIFATNRKRGQTSKLETNLCSLLSSPVKERRK